ncbi:phosphotransferase family protein [Hydrogenovibrio thermophilus]|uniref:Aminoglycoside phosphotransferase family protein n=1 Tax=Hydrogenovibrio thermophilus TaxID=265883 RepID=A0A410H4R7_9GAMM|nr:phosphotransferase [Hydrogenovibrio thermophilus]QAB15887.1 aminoglycoside phosphotransferase family protein [Hydrogenovibrio thermophilus]
MQPLTELYDPLRFLIIEVQKQLDSVTLFLETGDLRQAENGQKRVDYIDNYHVNLLNRAATYLGEQTDKDIRITVQSYEHINHGLKSLSRQLQAIIFQAKQSSTALKLLRKKNVFRALNDLQVGLELIEPAIESEGSMLAIDICRLKVHIDKRCDQQLEKYKIRLKKGQQTEALLHASFIIRDISDMGEALLRIGEGIISANMGQMIQIDRYHSLEATLTALQLNPQEDDLTIRAMGETKSGCTISGVMTAEESEGQMLAVFKEGDKAKLKEEKTGIESWHEKFPGIAPQVYSYHKSGNKAALLFEYLTGETFDKLLLQKNRKTLKAALNRLFETLTQIWEETRADQPYPANFMAQLRKRLKDVYEVHPEFQAPSVSINGVKSPTLEALVDDAEALESELPCPLGVYIHGDFNLDNIIYDPVDNDINFIDLHRSEYLDFVQDLSVLMVSAYRLSNFDPQVRKLIAQTMQAIYEFGQDYAEHIDDTSYHLRMALGLSRSFLTSTRFVLDKQHAKAMHFRGRYLIEQVIRLTEAERMTYRIQKEIFHD